MPTYRIKDWHKHYENNRTRELKKLDWVPMPNKQDGDGYCTIMDRPDGLEIFGAWVVILQIASKCSPRGSLIKDSGDPHDSKSIARMSGAAATKIERAIEVLASKDVNWIEVDEDSQATATDDEKRRAHGRVQNALARGYGVCTPAGILKARPDRCQWCDTENVRQGRNFPSVIAHHPIGYGEIRRDMTVIFVCRSCHGLMENLKITMADIGQKFGLEWMSKVSEIYGVTNNLVDESQSIATLYEDIPQPTATQPSGREGKRREGNTLRASPAIREPNPMWDAVCSAFTLKPVTKTECSRVGKIVSDLTAKGVNPAEISPRLARYRTAYPKLGIYTPEGLLKHWDACGGTTNRSPVSALADLHRQLAEAKAASREHAVARLEAEIAQLETKEAV